MLIIKAIELLIFDFRREDKLRVEMNTIYKVRTAEKTVKESRIEITSQRRTKMFLVYVIIKIDCISKNAY